jgi:hypothetical protein
MTRSSGLLGVTVKFKATENFCTPTVTLIKVAFLSSKSSASFQDRICVVTVLLLIVRNLKVEVHEALRGITFIPHSQKSVT